MNSYMNSKEDYADTAIIQEDSGICKTKSDIVDFCINYKSCCGTNPPTKECLCKHPFVQKCRTNFETCLKNNPKNLSQNDLMTSCIEENKACCIPYNNNFTISSDAFSGPIKNDPTADPICRVTTLPDLDQKCLELCSTTPNCVAYSLSNGSLVPTYGTCSLYDKVSIAKPKVDVKTGKPIEFITNYYVKKK